METQTLKAEVRETRGKGPARQLRMKGLIPAVFYGPGKSPQNLTVAPDALAKLVSGAWGRNQVIELQIGGEKELALVRDLAIDPLSRAVLHVDFYSVAIDRPVYAKVPFFTTGRPLGVQKGGRLRTIYRELPVLASPEKVPAKIEVDVGYLDTAQSLRVGEITLPEGVTIDFPPDRAVASIEVKEKEIVEEEGAPGAPGAPAAAAPAAGGKDAKAAPAAAAKAPAKDDKKKK